MINPFQILFDFTESFYSTTASLWNWFSSDISLFGFSPFSPFDIIFSWATLVVIIIAVMVKKLVPLT
jgi:hypothetical protein